MKKLRFCKKIDLLDELKDYLRAIEDVDPSLDQLGYIEPGHGARGRQLWLSSSEDLKDMYSLYDNKGEILFWCYGIKPSSVVSDKR